MATITKTKAGTYKAIIRRNNKALKTKTFKLKKHAREWARKIEGDTDLIKLYGSHGASATFNQLADEYEKWWSPDHNTIGLSFRLGFWRKQYGDTRIVDIDSYSIRAALKAYGKTRAPATVNRMRATLSSVFKFAIKECDYLQDSPVKRVSSLTEIKAIIISSEICHTKRRKFRPDFKKEIVTIMAGRCLAK
jgi:integrase